MLDIDGGLSPHSPSMSLESRHVRRILDDPVVIRPLAHPLWLKLHELVGREGPVTSPFWAVAERGNSATILR